MPKRIPIDVASLGMLVGETRQQPMQVGSLVLYKMRGDELAEEFAACYTDAALQFDRAVAPFNYRAARHGARLYWEEDAQFDISQHVRHLRLPYPGNIKELLKLIGVLHGTLMDRSYPLWYMWIISGLVDNRLAVFQQMHHSLIDGVSGARLITAAHSLDPDERDMIPFWALTRKGAKKKPVPEPDTEHVGDFVSMGIQMARSSARVMWAFARSWNSERIGRFRTGLYYAPDTLFNQEITGARRFVADSYSLSRIKAAGRKLDATINDVLLMMCSLAVRRYLSELGELPQRPLIAAIPVSLRTDDSVGGNQVTVMRATMATHEDRVEDQIEAILASVKRQKSILGSLSKDEIALYSVLTLGPYLAHTASGKLHQYKTFNLTLSNVPGSRDTLYWNGLEVDAIYPVSMPAHQQAINFTVFSYRDQLEMGIVGCRSVVPHLQRLIEYLHDALPEIERVGDDATSAGD